MGVIVRFTDKSTSLYDTATTFDVDSSGRSYIIAETIQGHNPHLRPTFEIIAMIPIHNVKTISYKDVYDGSET